MYSHIKRLLSGILTVSAALSLSSCIYKAGEDKDLLPADTSRRYQEPVTTAEEDISTEQEEQTQSVSPNAEPCSLDYTARYLDAEEASSLVAGGTPLVGKTAVEKDDDDFFVQLSFSNTLREFSADECCYDAVWEKTGLKNNLYKASYQNGNDSIILSWKNKSSNVGIVLTFRDGAGEIHSYTATANSKSDEQALNLYRAYPMTLTYEGIVEAYENALQNIKNGFSLGENSCYKTLEQIAKNDPYMRVCSKKEDINDDGIEELIVYAFSYITNYNGAILEILSMKDGNSYHHYLPPAESLIFRCADGLFLDVTVEYYSIKKVKLITVDWLCDKKTAYIDETVKTDGTAWYHVVDGETTKIGAGEADALITSYMKMKITE